jgi:hypothetical protein
VHRSTPHDGGERQALMAVAYLLHCFDDISSLGEVKRVVLAERVFGKERITVTLQRVTAISVAWGYRAQLIFFAKARRAWSAGDSARNQRLDLRPSLKFFSHPGQTACSLKALTFSALP